MTADLPAITAIYAREVLSGTATFEVDPPGEAEMAHRFAALEVSRLPALVADDGSGVAGYAYAAPFRERAAFRCTLEDSIYIRDDARGRGIGIALLEALIVASRSFGCRQMVAVIGDVANLASIRLHARAGFAPAGRLTAVGWKFDRWIDVVLMQRAL